MSEHAADLRLRREYGITLAQYNKVLAYQKGLCAICKIPPKGTRLSVDHCHTTGELRGLLCWACNRAIAGFKDSAILMEAGAKYIHNPPLRVCLGHIWTAPGKVGTKRRAKLLLKMKQGRP